jgi:hypothetical protein
LISIERSLYVQRRSPCGSELARDDGGKSNIDATDNTRHLQRLLPDQPTVFIKTTAFYDTHHPLKSTSPTGKHD